MQVEEKTLRILNGVFDSIQDGAAIYDAEDRLVRMNQNYIQYFEIVRDILKPGVLFSDLFRTMAERGMYDGPEADVEQWVEQRVRFFKEGTKGNEIRRNSGKWVRIDYYKLDGGGTFVITADITAQKDAAIIRNMLYSAIDAVEESLALYDADERLIFYNQKFREFNSALGDQLKPGICCEDLLRGLIDAGEFPDALGRERAWLDDRMERFRNPTGAFELARANRWLQVHDQRTPDGGCIMIGTDITTIKEAELAAIKVSERLRHLLDGSPLGVMVVSRSDSTRMFVNEELVRLFGAASRAALLSPSNNELWRDNDALKQAQVIVNSGAEIVNLEALCRRVDGSEWWAVLNSRSIDYEGEPARVIWFFDISARKAFEQQLVVAREAAETASRAKSEFLSMMSHELRTPLNAVLGFGQLLDMTEAVRESKKSQRAVAQILHSGQHLLHLIEDVLDLSSIELGQLKVSAQSIVLETLAEDCITSVRSLADANEVTVKIDAPQQPLPPIHADRQRLVQVLTNLLTNAVKYNKPGGEVRVGYHVVEPTSLRITVTDNGMGIAKERRAEVFEPFNRLGRESLNIEGTGIGLAIVSRLVHAMGGEVGFDSEVGQGSTFWVELRLTTAAAADSRTI